MQSCVSKFCVREFNFDVTETICQVLPMHSHSLCRRTGFSSSSAPPQNASLALGLADRCWDAWSMSCSTHDLHARCFCCCNVCSYLRRWTCSVFACTSAAVVLSLAQGSQSQVWMSRAEYDEHGPALLSKKGLHYVW